MAITVEGIYEDLLDQIVNLKIKPGEKISENRVGEKYDVSRTVVKGAFRILEQQGFLEVIPKSGTYVTKIDFSYIKSTVLLRMGLEKEILYRIIMNEKERISLMEKLKFYYERQLDHLDDTSDLTQFNKYDNMFHDEIFKGHGTYDTKKLIENHMLHFARWRNLTVISGYSLDRILKEHKEMIWAIENCDLDRIRRVIDLHLDKTLYSLKILDKKYRIYFK